jgi:peptidoglycan/LPS O-acetylase OafA/YrhL
MAKNITHNEAQKVRPGSRNALRERNWEILFVALVMLVSLLATVGMVLVSVFDPKNADNQFRILPAACLMMLVELWLIFSLPFYSKMAFWGGVIFLATYLFFAVPFVFLGLLPGNFMIAAVLFIVISLVCLLLLFRQRELFLRPARK